jgi:hypothetical protein
VAVNIQPPLPGAGGKKNKKVHDKAVYYAECRDERMEKSKLEKDAKVSLLDAMISEGIADYKWGNIEVHIDDKKDIKVKIKGADPADDDE